MVVWEHMTTITFTKCAVTFLVYYFINMAQGFIWRRKKILKGLFMVDRNEVFFQHWLKNVCTLRRRDDWVFIYRLCILSKLFHKRLYCLSNRSFIETQKSASNGQRFQRNATIAPLVVNISLLQRQIVVLNAFWCRALIS